MRSALSWPAAKGGVMTSDLVGRGRETDVLYGLVDGASSGGAALVVLGEAGIGKTVLMRAAAQHARDAGMLVVETTGIESQSGFPYAGLQQLLRPFRELAG